MSKSAIYLNNDLSKRMQYYKLQVKKGHTNDKVFAEVFKKSSIEKLLKVISHLKSSRSEKLPEIISVVVLLNLILK